MHIDEKHFRNETDKPIRIWTEPYVQEFTLLPGSLITFYADSIYEGEIEMHHVDGLLEVWFWWGAGMKVTIDGVVEFEVPDHLRFPVLQSAKPKLAKKKWWRLWLW